LWYIAGYIIRKVKKIETANNNTDSIALLDTFLEEDTDGEDDDVDLNISSKLWLTCVNRGGLLRCNNDFYSFIRAAEIEIKKILTNRCTNTGSWLTTMPQK
jgi:hypothetical protein